MHAHEWAGELLDAQQDYLRAMAYWMLGSLTEADDTLQEARLEARRAETVVAGDPGGWPTRIVADICVKILRSRGAPGEDRGVYVPDPIVSRQSPLDAGDGTQPAGSLGLPVLVVLDRLVPEERVAFVLDETQALPLNDIAAVLDCSTDEALRLTGAARRQIEAGAAVPDADLTGQREVVDGLFAAARSGNLEAVLEVLDPDVVLRSDGGVTAPDASLMVRGAQDVATRALKLARLLPSARPALVNGAAGAVVAPGGEPFSVMGYTVRRGKIVEIDALTDPERLRRLDLTTLDCGG